VSALYPACAFDRKGKLHSLSTARAFYTGAMDTNEAMPVIRRRKPRGRPITRAPGGEGGMAEGGNNYVAETPKNPIGASPGNRNAVTHGGYTVDSKARHAALRAAVRSLCDRADSLIAVVDAPKARLPLAERKS
jgi:hypothetical protein